MRPDEPRSACDENFHVEPLSSVSGRERAIEAEYIGDEALL
jgi:hypothetical protein